MTGKPEIRSQPIPMERAILWNPMHQTGRTSGRAPYPIFFQQEAVVALQDHLKASPDQAIFGFLAGELYRDPEVGVLFAVIDKTLRLNQPIYGDKTDVVVARLWDRMQQRLAQAQGRLLGWYHSHPGHPLTLSSHDVETHQKYFTDPWHVAVLVAADPGGGATGAFFRAGGAGGVAWPSTPLPFYELLQPGSVGSDGKKRSFVMWNNYKAFNPPTPKRDAPPPAPPRTPPPDEDFRIMKSAADDEPSPAPPTRRPSAPVFVPDVPPPPPSPPPTPAPRAMPVEQFPPKPSPLAPAPAPPSPLPPPPPPPVPRSGRTPTHGIPPAPRPRTPTHGMPPARRSGPSFRLLDDEAPRRTRRGRGLTVLAFLLLLAGVGAAGYWYYVLRDPSAPLPLGLDRYVGRRAAAPAAAPAAARPSPPPVDTTFARLDRLSDSTAVAVRNYHDRAGMFANGQLDCDGLARGLVALEDLWIAYNGERRDRASAFDARRAARDQALYQRVDSVEKQFEQTRCPRP